MITNGDGLRERVSAFLYVYVEDVDAHFKRSREAGATILSEVETGEPGKRYRAEDLEGHRWMFMQRR